nr:phosphoribosylformylglycinamidine cyclo-ligase [Maliibacterium massiliense]
MDYKQAGVDVEAGYEAVRLMKRHVAATLNARVLGGLGSFGGFYDIADMGLAHPVLVSGTDGVGTKLKLAFVLDRHDTVGIDCVAMCVNDIACQGARPLFFLDYLACGKLVPAQAERIVSGVATGCKMCGCALIGGETAEMPGFYPQGEYDLAGFAVGIVDKDKIVDGARIQAGDALVGLHASGVHSNGFSLVRKLVGETREALDSYVPSLGRTWGEALLAPTRIYVNTALSLLERFDVRGMAHITGGGFIENIPRMLPAGLGAHIDLGSWDIPPLFTLLQELGSIPQRSIFNTLNMGVGMVLAVPAAQADAVLRAARELGEGADIIGAVTQKSGEVTFG